MENTNIIEKITMNVTEETDRFIFKTISPFCAQVTQREIKKKDLEKALLLYFQKDRIIDQKGKVTFYRCPTCGWSITGSQKACDDCGQRLKSLI